MREFKFLLIFSFLMGMMFCAKKNHEKAYPVITEVIGDVQTVTNPNYPRDGVVQDILLEEISIGLEEGPEEYMFNRPFDVQAADDGTIFVLDWGDITIKVYDKDGTYLRTIGQKGQGPGDFGFLLYMTLSSDGRIFIMNTVNRRVTIYNVLGEYLGGFGFEGSYNDMKTDGQNRIYYSKRKRKTDIAELPVTKDFIEVESIVQVFRNKTGGEDLYLLGEFEGEKDQIKRMGAESSMSLSSEFNVVWEISKEGLLYEGFNQEYKINVFDQSGKKLLSFSRDYEPVTLEFGNEDNIRKRVMPAYDPRIGWVFDEEGNLWVSIYSENEGEVIYDVFSPEGIYTKQVILPCRICQIKKGKVYSIISTEEGYMTVKRFSLKTSTVKTIEGSSDHLHSKGA
jgi:hypothetical protein